MLQLRFPRLEASLASCDGDGITQSPNRGMTATRSSDTSLRAGFPAQPKMSAEEEAQ